MLNEAISGLNAGTTASLSWAVIPNPPPVVVLTTTSDLLLISVRTVRNNSRSEVGLPFEGSLTWMCTIAAPASAAFTASSAICSGVIGRYGLIVGVWTAPVTAAVMTTFPDRGDASTTLIREGPVLNRTSAPSPKGRGDIQGKDRVALAPYSTLYRAER